jgi:hypothetical protein
MTEPLTIFFRFQNLCLDITLCLMQNIIYIFFGINNLLGLQIRLLYLKNR